MVNFVEYAQLRGVKRFGDRLVKNYGKNFVSLLLTVYLLLKGFVASAIGLSLLPFFKNTLKVNEKTYQIYMMIAWIPWSIKAFIGSISDLYPLFGYHSQGYMLVTSFVGSAALLALGGSSSATTRHPIVAPLLIFLVMLQISVIDLLCEAKYAREMKNMTKSDGGDVVAFVWGCVVTGAFVASSFVGVFTDYFSPVYVYLICFPFTIYVLVPIAKNYMGERRLPTAEVKILTEKLNRNYKIFVLAFSIAFFAIGMAVVNLVASEHFVLLYSIGVSVVLCSLSLWFQERKKAKCNVYLFLVEATYIQIPGAMDYWYTADSSCVANGPNFNMTYYLTYTNMVGSIAGIAGIVLFQMKMSKWSFRRALLMSSFIRICSSFFDIFIVSRLNIRLGVPDKVAYMLGDALILNTASMLASMPAVMLTASIVNDGLESTTYAILAGFQNFGQNVSKSVGVALMTYFGIDADARPCRFEKLPQLIFVAHSLLPVLPVLLLALLIDREDSPATPAAAADAVEAPDEYGLLPGNNATCAVSVSSDSGLVSE